MNQTVQNIAGRRSIRSYQPQQITDEQLRIILEAGKAAPSSLNRQPWHFTVIQNKALIDRMVEDNREVVLTSPELIGMCGWVNAPNYHNFYHAPTVILISGDTANYWHVCDCALAMQNMSLAAWSLSIGSCIIASARFLFTSEKADEYREKFEIPQGYAPLFALSLGYSAGGTPEATPRRDDCIHYIR